MPSVSPPEALLQRFREGRRFLLTSHVNPDGDAVGSSLGLARILTAWGKHATIWLRDPVPVVYRQLPGAEQIHVGATPPEGFPGSFDLGVCLECPTLDRCGLEDALGRLPLINLDHHLGNDFYGVVQWVDPDAPAAGEMVFRLTEALGVELDAVTATLLYLTIVTDTGGFRFANATPQAFEAAARLVHAGARPEQVSLWLHESQPLAALRLLGEMLPTLEIHAGGRLATVLLTLEMFQRAGAAPGDSEGLVDYPRSIAGVEAVALCREKSPGLTKVSLRSRGDVNVERIARRHGGGGHKNAAGCELALSPAAARGPMVEALAAALGLDAPASP